MRLWHFKLLPFLPDSQLKAQWRELNSIFKNQPNHILINYVYEYPKEDLMVYMYKVINEMLRRNFKIRNLENSNNYFGVTCAQQYIDTYNVLKEIFEDPVVLIDYGDPFAKHHNDRYLLQCFYNLQEKRDRGQKDFSEVKYQELEKFVQEGKYEEITR